MVRRGWRSLGDDKLLLPMNGNGDVMAIKQMLNVDPDVRRWFPEVGDLTVMPPYSAWTTKRRVSLGAMFPSAPATQMPTTHLVVVDRQPRTKGIHVSSMTAAEAISALLHQSVIPHDAPTAAGITRALARLGERVSGVKVSVGDDAYADPDALIAVEAALR